MKNKVISLFGLIRIANRLVLGDTLLESFSKGNIHFVFVASDASLKTRERYLKKCHYYHINYSLDFNTDELSAALGRSHVKTIGITDLGFAKAIIKELEGGCNYGETNKEETN